MKDARRRLAVGRIVIVSGTTRKVHTEVMSGAKGVGRAAGVGGVGVVLGTLDIVDLGVGMGASLYSKSTKNFKRQLYFLQPTCKQK